MQHFRIIFVMCLSSLFGHRLAASTAALGDVVPHRSCYDAATCTVHEVRVHGCQRISAAGRCHVRHGTTLSIGIAFTPAFNATHVDHQVQAWSTRSASKRNPFGPWDACRHRGEMCPLVGGVRQSFRAAFRVLESYPAVCRQIIYDRMIWNMIWSF